ncbi:MAG TPA: zinc ribbon domain-containing protein [Jatrophihabitantaceae bacterium]|jgi:uncharacterized OB-fold protein
MTALDPVVDSVLFLDAPVGERTALRASRCETCGRVEFPRRTSCPACGTESVPCDLSGSARLRVLTAVLAPPPGAKVPAPYQVGVAEFDEGVCVIGLVDGDATKGDQVVPFVHEPYEDGRTFAFRRAQGAHL